MATFVLVHGSWAGSVVWRQLAPRLRKAGHEVYAPTLTGIGERKHLLSRDIDLDGWLALPGLTDCGRDVHYWAPPAQNRTCGFPAYGSHLGCLTAKRSLGQG